MKGKYLLLVLLLTGGAIPALAADSATAAAQYEADKKLCAEESNAALRMQCLRDANAEYNKALAGAGGTIAAGDAAKAAQERAAARYAADKKLCAEDPNSSVRMQCLRDANAEYNKALAAARNIGPTGSPPKPPASGCADCGMVAGVTAGKRDGGGPLGGLTGVRFWSVLIKLDSGELRTIEFDQEPGVRSGDLVRLNGNTLTRR